MFGWYLICKVRTSYLLGLLQIRHIRIPQIRLLFQKFNPLFQKWTSPTNPINKLAKYPEIPKTHTKPQKELIIRESENSQKRDELTVPHTPHHPQQPVPSSPSSSPHSTSSPHSKTQLPPSHYSAPVPTPLPPFPVPEIRQPFLFPTLGIFLLFSVRGIGRRVVRRRVL